ncbi:hypothetical protein ACWCOW_42910, partial [Streptomyces sp. NPDC001939]
GWCRGHKTSWSAAPGGGLSQESPSLQEGEDSTEHRRLEAVLVHCPELDALTGHVRSFGQMLAERRGERLPQWLDAVRRDDLPSLHTLAAGIDRDRDAVSAGLTLPWSSGVVEGPSYFTLRNVWPRCGLMPSHMPDRSKALGGYLNLFP